MADGNAGAQGAAGDRSTSGGAVAPEERTIGGEARLTGRDYSIVVRTSTASTLRSSGDTCTSDQSGKLAFALVEARKQVRAALAALAPARQGYPVKPEVAALLRTHFRSDSKLTVKDVDFVFTLIDHILRTGLALFRCDYSEDQCKKGGHAYSSSGVRPMPGSLSETELTSVGKVFLCPPFFDLLPEELEVAGRVVVHECAHVAGRANVPIDEEIYRYQRVYRGMSEEDAVRTADAFAVFAMTITHGPQIIPVTGHSTTPLGGRLGIAPDKVLLLLSVSASGTLSVPQIDFLNPKLKVEASLVPDTGNKRVGGMVEATLGILLAQPGDKIFVDVAAGIVLSGEWGNPAIAGALVEANIGYDAGTFDIAFFWKRYHDLFKSNNDVTFIGVQGGL